MLIRPYLPCTVASYVHTVAELHVPRPARQCQPPAFQLDGFTRFPTTTSPPHHPPRPSSSLAPQHLRTEACPRKPSHARSSPSSSVFPMPEDGGTPPPTVLPVPIPYPCPLRPRTEVCPHQPSHHCWRMPTQHRPCALRCQDSVFARPVSRLTRHGVSTGPSCRTYWWPASTLWRLVPQPRRPASPSTAGALA